MAKWWGGLIRRAPTRATRDSLRGQQRARVRAYAFSSLSLSLPRPVIGGFSRAVAPLWPVCEEARADLGDLSVRDRVRAPLSCFPVASFPERFSGL